jgi:2-oxoglutarate ferredoxin oxidoreductase subunit alpha
MARTTLSFVFAGSGGSGAMTAGAFFLRAAAGAGYFGTMTQLFGAQVRGGESASLITVSTEPVESPPDFYDVFVALDWEKVDQFAAEIPLRETSTVIADPAAGAIPASIAKSKAHFAPLSFDDPAETRLERALRGRHNNVSAAALAGTLIGISPQHLEAALGEVLGRNSAVVLAGNRRALARGIEKSKEVKLDLRLDLPSGSPRWLITGNQATAFGALRGGVRFVGCYPITPATDLVEWLAPNMRALGGNLVLAEDELASINMVLGASFGGVPAMTVTAGPGLALMTEAIGLGVAAEIPAVVVDVMRAGPSTGIASKTEQSDLNIAIYGGHGDAPRVVLAPMSVGDCALTAEWAVYVAEALQTPVLLLSDQSLGQTLGAIPVPTERPPVARRRTNGVGSPAQFKRYAVAGDPITPMPRPGAQGYEWVAEGLTHNEAGLPVSGAGLHVAQINKRAKKIEQFDPGALWGVVWGQGEIAIVAFGSSVPPAREAAKRLTSSGLPTRVVGLRVIAPVPAKELRSALKGAKRIIVLEQNQSSQLLHHLLGQRALPSSTESIARPGPLPFRPAEIAGHIA